MAPQITRRCHWVSQSYLRTFAADSDRTKIWRFGKSEGQDPELKSIKKVAVRHHLYAPVNPNGVRDDALERKLSDLEKWLGSPIWRQLCSGEMDLTWEPLRKIIALIVATTYVRNPAFFEKWKSLHRRMVDEVSALPRLPTQVTIGGVKRDVDTSDWPTFRAAGEEEMKAAWNEYVASAGDIAPRLLKMRFAILMTERPAFITSDNPVTITHPSLEFRGVNDPETIILFPISPTRMLALDNRHSEPDGLYYEGGNPAWANYTIWRNANEHMFSPRNPHEVIAEIVADAEQTLAVV